MRFFCLTRRRSGYLQSAGRRLPEVCPETIVSYAGGLRKTSPFLVSYSVGGSPQVFFGAEVVTSAKLGKSTFAALFHGTPYY